MPLAVVVIRYCLLMFEVTENGTVIAFVILNTARARLRCFTCVWSLQIIVGRDITVPIGDLRIAAAFFNATSLFGRMDAMIDRHRIRSQPWPVPVLLRNLCGPRAHLHGHT